MSECERCHSVDELACEQMQEIKTLQAKLATATASLVRIRDNGGYHYHGKEWNGAWCGEQARRALEEIGHE